MSILLLLGSEISPGSRVSRWGLSEGKLTFRTLSLHIHAVINRTCVNVLLADLFSLMLPIELNLLLLALHSSLFGCRWNILEIISCCSHGGFRLLRRFSWQLITIRGLALVRFIV